VKQDKIWYRDMDQYSDKISVGHMTTWCYYHEFENGKISSNAMDAMVGLNFRCGEFSYAEIPREFNCIMGVTGTLKDLSPIQKRIVNEQYGIHRMVFMPSVFKISSLGFIPEIKKDIHIETLVDFHKKIAEEIEGQLIGKGGKTRSVIVFFETLQKLRDFENSNTVFQNRKEKAFKLIETMDAKDKEYTIKNCTSSDQVTISTASFGRGTDFVCRDVEINANGGIHIIQTFLSEDISEEIQIKGRTCRQGKPGSYSMILLDSDLEVFLLKEKELHDIETKGNAYPILNTHRNESFAKSFHTCHLGVSAVRDAHFKSKDFMKCLLANQETAMNSYLLRLNGGTILESSYKTIILMDATGSMTHLIEGVKHQIQTMFERCRQILKQNNMSTDSFEVQFACYRNYNVDDNRLLVSSPWESNPENLKAFMKQIGPDGGCGNEAIEIGFAHVNSELEKGVEVKQVILIGDMPPNTREQVIYNRNRYAGGDPYWSKSKYPKPTTWEEELKKIHDKGIPVHAFYVDMSAKVAFETIGSGYNIKGKCEFLNINAKDRRHL
jgi:hypothetical protein